MMTFKVLAALLDYPGQDLVDALDELDQVLEAERLLPAKDRRDLREFTAQMKAADLLGLQERYVDLFDRGRKVSLYLFEHIHGESRDRGQAMVDLARLYRSHGLELAPGELPDFLPAFLEYLSRRPLPEAQALLAETGHILKAIAQNLAKRGTPYSVPLNALLGLAGERRVELAAPAGAQEEDSLEALDRAWEDQPVAFGGGCGTQEGEASVIRFVKGGAR